MAEFGIQATQLSPAQGAGAEVINPIQEKAVDTSILNSPIVSGLVDIFSKGLTNNAKAEAEARKQAVIKGYVRAETSINEATATGQMDAASASARSRANFNKYAAGYSEYIEDFQKAGNALKGFTEKGVVEDELATQKKQREADIAQAQNRGFTFVAGMTPEAQNQQIRASKSGINMEREMGELYKANAEKRAQGNFDTAATDRDTKETSTRLINKVVGDNMDAFNSLGAALVANVKGGGDLNAARAQLAERFGNIGAAIQASARVNPELAAPYRSLFNEANDVYKKMLEPGAATAELEDQLKAVQTKLKLVAYSDPKAAAYITVSNLFGNNPALELGASRPAIDAISRLSAIKLGDITSHAPQVFANPEVESDTIKVLKGAAGKLLNPNTKNAAGLKVEVGNTTNQILKQVGEAISTGKATPQNLKGMAEFFASPEYAQIVQSKVIDKEAAGAAVKTFQLQYEPAIIKGVQEKMATPLHRGWAEIAGPNTKPSIRQKPATTLGEAVTANFTGSGVVFSAKDVSGMAESQTNDRKEQLSSLQSSQKALNQLIHMGAHMAGSTDYAGYWEANKHVLLPNMFSKYKDLEIGTVKNGYRYKGGDSSEASNWDKL